MKGRSAKMVKIRRIITQVNSRKQQIAWIIRIL